MDMMHPSPRPRRPPRLLSPRLRLASLLKLLEPVIESRSSRFRTTLDFKSRMKPKRDKPETDRRKARVIRVDWDYEEAEDDVQFQPGEVPSQSGASRGYTYNWTW